MGLERPLSLDRLENLSDGVFAFAMTFLVVGLGVDDAFELMEDGDLEAGLRGMAPRLLTLVLGLAGLGAFWLAHVIQFRHVRAVDRNLVFLNFVPLLAIILLPFSIALWGRRWQDPWAFVVVGVNLAAYNAALALEWLYIVRQRRASGEPVEARLRRRAAVGFLVPNVPWAAFALVAFVSPAASLAILIVSTLAYATPRLSRPLWGASR